MTIEEGHLMTDHVHMLVSIPPKYSVAEVIGVTGRVNARVSGGVSWPKEKRPRTAAWIARYDDFQNIGSSSEASARSMSCNW